MNRNEYKRFLGGLTKEQRRRFEEQGTFEELAGYDGIIDLFEFHELVDEVVTKYDEEAIKISLRST